MSVMTVGPRRERKSGVCVCVCVRRALCTTLATAPQKKKQAAGSEGACTRACAQRMRSQQAAGSRRTLECLEVGIAHSR